MGLFSAGSRQQLWGGWHTPTLPRCFILPSRRLSYVRGQRHLPPNMSSRSHTVTQKLQCAYRGTETTERVALASRGMSPRKDQDLIPLLKTGGHRK